jgi:hypothetical protein
VTIVEAGIVGGHYWIMFRNPLQFPSVLDPSRHNRVGINTAPRLAMEIFFRLVGQNQMPTAGFDLLTSGICSLCCMKQRWAEMSQGNCGQTDSEERSHCAEQDVPN